MKDHPDQTPELRDAFLVTSPLNARLGGRLTQSVGVIDTKRVERHHARLTQWLAERYALLGRFQTRYGGQELAPGSNPLVMQQALQEQINIFNEAAPQIAAHTPPSISAPSTSSARGTSAPPETNDPSPQGKLRLSRRPPQRDAKHQTVDSTRASSASQGASSASSNALPVSADNQQGATTRAANDAATNNESQTPSSAPTRVNSVRAVEQTSPAALPRAVAVELPLTGRTSERAEVESQSRTRAIKPGDTASRPGTADSTATPETPRASAQSVAPSKVSGPDAGGGELILRKTSAPDAEEKGSAPPSPLKATPQVETTRAVESPVFQTLAPQTSALTSDSGIRSASEIPVAAEIREKNETLVLRDEARGEASMGSPVAASEREAASVATASPRIEEARQAETSSTLPLVRQQAAQAQSADARASVKPPATNVSSRQNAGAANVAFEIQEASTHALTPRIVWRKGDAVKGESYSAGEADGDVLYAAPRRADAASSSHTGEQPVVQSQRIVPASSTAQAQGAQVDIGRITEQVIRALSRRMSVERERRGLRR